MDQNTDLNRINNTENGDLKKVIQEQTALLRDIRNDLHSIKRAAMMSKIVNLVIFFIFFVAPIIIGLVYLPTMINSLSSSLGGLYGTGVGTSNIDIMKILTDPNYLKQIQGQTQTK